jgi:acetylornithine deacetylase/succinyl-diaminopimelate desuccinylase-like protein
VNFEPIRVMAINDPIGSAPVPPALGKEREQWVKRAWDAIDESKLAELNRLMASIPSPTGEEKQLGQAVVDVMNKSAVDAFYQRMDDDQGNAIGRIIGTGDGADLLLYAPLDTAFSTNAEEECPWIGDRFPAEMTTDAVVRDGDVVGMGAENPKGYAACVVAAAQAIKAAGVPLRGSLLVGLGAGGMPTNRRPLLQKFNAGQGAGCAYMLEQGVRGDFALIAKPGWSVAWEEVGLCWFKVIVRGDLNYTGVRHVVKGRNPIVHAAKVIGLLEEWFSEYTEKNTSGLVAPQGSINAIQAGWTHKPAFVPAACHLYVDLRISPRVNPTEAKRQFAEAIARIVKINPELTIEWEMILSIPGSFTDPNNWIIQSCIRAWEFVESKKHQPRTGTSGATDANILRAAGIPTARLGMPRRASANETQRSRFSMETSSVAGMKQLTKCLVYATLDTCTRERAEVIPHLGAQGSR